MKISRSVFSRRLFLRGLKAITAPDTGGGPPASLIIDGVTMFLLADDEADDFLTDDETNEALYDEAA